MRDPARPHRLRHPAGSAESRWFRLRRRAGRERPARGWSPVRRGRLAERERCPAARQPGCRRPRPVRRVRPVARQNLAVANPRPAARRPQLLRPRRGDPRLPSSDAAVRRVRSADRHRLGRRVRPAAQRVRSAERHRLVRRVCSAAWRVRSADRLNLAVRRQRRVVRRQRRASRPRPDLRTSPAARQRPAVRQLRPLLRLPPGDPRRPRPGSAVRRVHPAERHRLGVRMRPAVRQERSAERLHLVDRHRRIVWQQRPASGWCRGRWRSPAKRPCPVVRRQRRLRERPIQRRRNRLRRRWSLLSWPRWAEWRQGCRPEQRWLRPRLAAPQPWNRVRLAERRPWNRVRLAERRAWNWARLAERRPWNRVRPAERRPWNRVRPAERRPWNRVRPAGRRSCLRRSPLLCRQVLRVPVAPIRMWWSRHVGLLWSPRRVARGARGQRRGGLWLRRGSLRHHAVVASCPVCLRSRPAAGRHSALRTGHHQRWRAAPGRSWSRLQLLRFPRRSVDPIRLRASRRVGFPWSPRRVRRTARHQRRGGRRLRRRRFPADRPAMRRGGRPTRSGQRNRWGSRPGPRLRRTLRRR